MSGGSPDRRERGVAASRCAARRRSGRTSLRYDRDDKIPLYARHGIPEVWLVNFETKRLVRYRSRQQGACALIGEPDFGSSLEIASLSEARIDVSSLIE
jgi:hypothetical protein